MIERQAGGLLVKVPLVMSNARALLEAGCAALRPGEQVIDFAGIGEADSSAIAVMLGWLRGAALTGASIKFARVPAGVLTLAELYGVTELLPLV